LEGHLILLADRGKKTKLPKSSPKPTPVKTVTLNLYGAFPNPWAGKPNIEILRADPDPKKSKWHPSQDDWNAIFDAEPKSVDSIKKARVDSFKAFLGFIAAEKPGTIAAINLFSHGKDDLIGFGGTIDSETGEVGINDGKHGGLDESVISDLTMRYSHSLKDGTRIYEETPACLAHKYRDRFVEGKGQIRLFLCNSGALRGPLLQNIADAFQVIALGFPERVGNWIDPGSPIVRGYTYVWSEGNKTRKRGFSHLIPKLVTRKPNKTSAECLPP